MPELRREGLKEREGEGGWAGPRQPAYAKGFYTPLCIGVVVEVVAANVQNMRVGEEVTCPKCGEVGRVGIDKFRAGGKTYLYWTVRHYEGSKVRRCVIARADGSAAETTRVEIQVPAGPKAAVQETKAVTAKREVTAKKASANIAVKEVVKKVPAKVAGTETATQPAQTAPQPAVDYETIREVVREEVAKAVEAIRVPQVVETKVEVPREVVEAIAAIRDQIAAIQREAEYIKEQVRQRKGWGARAVARGEKRIEFREGNLYWMIAQIMSAGGEWTKEQLAEEIRKRFGKEVSGNSVSGRLSELAAAGFVAGRREGRTWLWRWTGP